MVELGFEITGAGPLNQLAISPASVETCVYLAMSAYGWYKSRARASTLAQILDYQQTPLRHLPDFNERRFTQSREGHGIRGVTATAGVLQQHKLSKWSTSKDGGPRWQALRALVLALSCISTDEQVCKVLKIIIPECLLERELEAGSKFEGPALAVLRDYVETVIAEEGIDSLREKLIDDVYHRQKALEISTAERTYTFLSSDLAHIAGFLKWLLSPTGPPVHDVYLTRSLHVWRLCSILTGLGFEVEASNSLVSKSPTKGSFEPSGKRGIPELSLVFTSELQTDIGASSTREYLLEPLQAPPRVVPLRILPVLAFEGTCRMQSSVQLSCLEAAFADALNSTWNTLRGETFIESVCELKRDVAKYPPLPQRKHVGRDSVAMSTVSSASRLTQDKPGAEEMLLKLLAPLVRRHIKSDPSPVGQNKLNVGDRALLDQICMGIALGALLLFARRHGGGITTESALDVDVVFSHYFQYQEQPKPNEYTMPQVWCSKVLNMLGLMDSIFTPYPERLKVPFAPADPDAIQSIARNFLKDLCRDWIAITSEVICGTNAPSEQIFGACNSGVVILSHFILKPSSNLSAFFVYSLERGQLLNVPLKNGFVTDGFSANPNLPDRAVLDASYELGNVASERSRNHIDWMRCDVEPCWDGDTKGSCFIIRSGGITRLEIGPALLLQCLHQNFSNRIYHEKDLSLTPRDQRSRPGQALAQADRWVELPIESMQERGQHAVARLDGINTNTDRVHWIAYAQDSEILALLALSCTFVPSLAPTIRIVVDGIETGLESARTMGYPEKRVLMILLRRETKQSSTSPDMLSMQKALCFE